MATFTEAFNRMRESFDQGHQDRVNLIRDTRRHVAEQARQTGTQLADQAKRRQADFAAMMGELRGQVREQARQTRQQLAAVAADLHLGGNVFNRR